MASYLQSKKQELCREQSYFLHSEVKAQRNHFTLWHYHASQPQNTSVDPFNSLSIYVARYYL